ncbi:hypothetical protein [Pedobacter caeni]|uniref:Uncharacterized protein n=1 Tax=Pedobacter caeni TaxID=288992 RepID=A0A1M5F3Q3_9SPHI|nr:hypothetical protein [Pedobacter caeni]SHF86144.1 hypothetical protein SAMN04488522_103922 [Pedobacter caeni]
MIVINLSDFQFITSKYGSEKGETYFDEDESLVHKIYSDRIVFSTNFMDYRSYEIYLKEETVCIKRMKEGDRKPIPTEYAIDGDDIEEIESLWRRMEREQIIQPRLSDLDVHTELSDLFSYMLTETDAEIISKKLPSKKKPDLNWIWKQIELALSQTNRLTSFEWKEWAEIGIVEVNGLASIQQLNVEIPYPSQQEVEDITNAPDWEGAILQYFNTYLTPFELKLLAIGTYFDEYQTFACLQMQNLKLLNAIEKFDKLGIKYKY